MIKAGWVIGGSGGSGVLYFHGRRLSAVDRRARLRHRVRRLEDRCCMAASATSAGRPTSPASTARPAPAWRSARGARAIVLTNQKGAVLELAGRQVGLMANADLSGLAITLR